MPNRWTEGLVGGMADIVAASAAQDTLATVSDAASYAAVTQAACCYYSHCYLLRH